jgi:hypothetical protein
MWSDNDLLGFQYLTKAVCGITKNEHLLPATIGVNPHNNSGTISGQAAIRWRPRTGTSLTKLKLMGRNAFGQDEPVVAALMPML